MFSTCPSLFAHRPPGGQAQIATLSTVRVGGRQRHDWVRCEVHCLMCGRLLGRLLGVSRTTSLEHHSVGDTVAFIAFRPIDPPGPVVAFTRPRPFTCDTCRGTGRVDEMELFSTYAEFSTVQDPAVKRSRGRPPRPFRKLQGSTPLQLALARL